MLENLVGVDTSVMNRRLAEIYSRTSFFEDPKWKGFNHRVWSMKFENVKYAEALKVHLHDDLQLPILQNTTPGELSREYEDVLRGMKAPPSL